MAAGSETEIGSGVTLYHGDCLEEMKRIQDGIVDCVITDLPYGVLNAQSEGGKWDSVIPFDPLWKQFLRVTKRSAAICLFGQGMFTANLMRSQPKLWRYNLIWDKCRVSGFLNSKRMPLRRHEDICVFYRELPTYNPQMEELGDREPNHPQGRGNHKETNRCYGEMHRVDTCGVEGKKFPSSILKFKRPHCAGNHPTEKSVELCEYLVRTYTNEGDLVLDATAGSGTTAVAAVRAGRKVVAIERDGRYFDVMKRRVMNEMWRPKQLDMFA